MTSEYHVVVEAKAVKQLIKFDRPQRVLLLEWIKRNLEGCENPYTVNGAKKLEAVKGGVRYRVGAYRILATVHQGLVEIRVFSIGHRSVVYRDL